RGRVNGGDATAPAAAAGVRDHAVRRRERPVERRSSVLAWLGTVMLCLSVFSGNFRQVTGWLPVDRVVMAAFLLTVLYINWRYERPRFRVVHAILLAQVLWIAGSAALGATLLRADSFYAALDQVIVPSVLFTIAPIAFHSAADRLLLLRALAITALYVGVMSTLQSLGIGFLLFPRYLAEAAVAGEITRAVGPSLQVASNGAMLTMCIAPLIMLLKRSTGWWRLIAALGIVAVSSGAFLTLTRSVWLAWILAVGVYVALDPTLRRPALRLLGALAVVLALLLVAVPPLFEVVSDRFTTQRSLDDRSTTNIAALSMLDTHPILGVGWGRFLDEVDSYVRQQDLVPLTTTHIPAHNIVLSRAAETGAVGAALFLASLIAGPIASVVRSWRGVDREWGIILLSAFGAWLSVAMLTPMGYTFPNYFLWLLAGIVAVPAGATVTTSFRTKRRRASDADV
ncbi:MAG: O-antigen ligase family protein, partial [Microbacterium sp.]